MGKIIHDTLQCCDIGKEDIKFEEDTNLNSVNVHKDSRDCSQNINSQCRSDGDAQGEDHIKRDFNGPFEHMRLQSDDQNRENIAESKAEKVCDDQEQLQVEEVGVPLTGKEEQRSETHKRWSCLSCEQDNDDFARNISEQHGNQQEVTNSEDHAENSGKLIERWQCFQCDVENEKFLQSESETQRAELDEYICRVTKQHEDPEGHDIIECHKVVNNNQQAHGGFTQEVNFSCETSATNLQDLQEFHDAQEPRGVIPTLTERVEILREQFDVVLERNKQLEECIADFVRREKDLEVILDRQTQQITSVDERQVEQERVLLVPMRNIYIRQFHDLIRENISQKMSGTSIYARQLWALKQRVNQHERAIRERLALASQGGDLWQFIKEAHTVAPKFFCKDSLWNKFLDAILDDEEQLRILGLSRAAVELTRYGRPPPTWARGNLQSSRQDANFRNKFVFAKIVVGQIDELRPLYAELYEFFYKVPPETMYIKGRARHDHEGPFLWPHGEGEFDLPGQSIQVLKDETVIV